MSPARPNSKHTRSAKHMEVPLLGMGGVCVGIGVGGREGGGCGGGGGGGNKVSTGPALMSH